MTSITGLYQCPDCGATVTFRSKETRIMVCKCETVLSRSADDVLVIKPLALNIYKSNDLIQRGTQGVFVQKKFEVIGRIRMWFDESVINYWTILFDDESIGYLVEAYGLYAVWQKTTTDKFIMSGNLESIALNRSIKMLGDKNFFLQRKEVTSKYELEGEVWLPETNGNLKMYDLAAKDGQRISFIEFLTGFMTAYEVSIMSFKEFQFRHLNDGPTEAVKKIECKGCNTTLEIKTFPYAQSCACAKCGTRYALNRSFEFQKITDRSEIDAEISIPLGSRGVLKGIKYEVLGFSVKRDDTSDHAQWREYTLYNREEGYAFLSEYDGNWIYVRERLDCPVVTDGMGNSFSYDGEEYQLYNKYGFTVRYAAGEFPYNIYDDYTIRSLEYISPPEMWITEKSKEEGINWFFGEEIKKRTLENAFNVKLPKQVGLGALDPRGYVNPLKIIVVTLIALAAMIAVHAFIAGSQSEAVIMDKQFFVNDTASVSTFVTDKFQLTKWRSNLEIEVFASVDNDWFELDATLVNAKDGTEYTIEQGVEYYHGYEDGESWSEGATRETVYLSSIPAGEYYLQLQGVKNPVHNIDSFYVTVKNDVPMIKNLIIFILLLLIWPVIRYYMVQRTERQRWYNSNYSPYNYDNGN